MQTCIYHEFTRGRHHWWVNQSCTIRTYECILPEADVATSVGVEVLLEGDAVDEQIVSQQAEQSSQDE